MPGATSSIIMEVEPKMIYGVVCDFESYTDFLPEIRQAETLKKSAKGARARFEIKVIKTIHYTLDYQLKPHREIAWKFVEGNLFKDCFGSWQFEEIEPGVTEATYNINVDFGLFVPKAITNMLVGNNLPAMMKQFKERAEGL